MGRLKLIFLEKYILAVDEAAEIKAGDWQINYLTNKINQRTNYPLEITTANCSKIIAHLPLTEKIEGLLELPEMEDVEKMAFEHSANQSDEYIKNHPCPKGYPAESFMNLIRLFKLQSKKDFIAGYKARGGYSESDLRKAIEFCRINRPFDYTDKQVFESLKPKYFETSGEVESGKLKGKYLNE